VKQRFADLGFGTRRLKRRIALLGGYGVLSGIAESAAVVLIVALASRSGSERLPVLGLDAPQEGLLIGLSLAAVVLLAGAHWGSARAAASVASETERRVQEMLVAAYLRAPWGAQTAVRTGELQDLVTKKAGQVAYGAQQVATAVATAVNLGVVFVAAVAVSPWATALLLAAMLIVLLVALPFRAGVRRAARGAVDASSALAAEVTETALAIGDLRVFGVLEPAEQRLAGRLAQTAKLHEAVRRAALALPALTRDASLAVLVVGLAVIVANSQVALTTLGVTVILVFRALAHAQTIAGVAQSLVQRRANLDLIRQRLRDWHTPMRSGTQALPGIDRVWLERVRHAYVVDRPAALDGVTLEVCRGELLGVVGRTGAGKSTLASILLGVIVPTEGEVLVDGIPLADLAPAQWHARTAWVAQEPRLLSGSVRENVRFLRPWVSDEDVMAAARSAGLDRELASWPGGIDHEVGPAGASLSGGERQRVALARALAGAPELLVLDEPTSALDAHSEEAVREALVGLRHRAAVVVIAHRLSTVRSCDRVAVLDGGRLVALAPPGELEQSNRWFREALLLAGAGGVLP